MPIIPEIDIASEYKELLIEALEVLRYRVMDKLRTQMSGESPADQRVMEIKQAGTKLQYIDDVISEINQNAT